jgi:site-specific DNA-methyltransferase (adenine-specific)
MTGVTVSYDSSQVYLRTFEPGNHVLNQGDGTVLFLSQIEPEVPSVELGGAIMGATSATAVTGAGLCRQPLASDVNPIALALARAKNTSVEAPSVASRLAQLREGFDRLTFLPDANVQDDDIQLIYHPGTLAQLCYLRRSLVNSHDQEDEFLLGALLGVMHGSERQDGSSAYASISMPNTFSMSPNYVRKFVATNRLSRVERDVFEILEAKISRLFRAGIPDFPQGEVMSLDAKELAGSDVAERYAGKVGLVVTSPPYLAVVNYAKQNWIRDWLLARSGDQDGVSALDDKLNLGDWLDFLDRVVDGLEVLLAPGGTIAMVVGDVAKPGKNYISLARDLIQRMSHRGGFGWIGCLEDDSGSSEKTTRIWKDTKGRATDVDRVILLSRSKPKISTSELASSLGVEGGSIDTSLFDADLLAEKAGEFSRTLSG